MTRSRYYAMASREDGGADGGGGGGGGKLGVAKLHRALMSTYGFDAYEAEQLVFRLDASKTGVPAASKPSFGCQLGGARDA
jgi:hypothetical protein